MSHFQSLSNISPNKNIELNNMINNQYNEINKMKEKIANLRISLFKIKNESTKLKTEQMRNEEDFKKNNKIIEEILLTTNKSDSFLINKIIYDKNFNDENIKTINLNKNNLQKLKELYIINVIKTKNKEITKQILEKENQLDVIKNSTKKTKLNKLENNIMKDNAELNELKEKFTILRYKYLNGEERLKKISEENINLKKTYQDLKIYIL